MKRLPTELSGTLKLRWKTVNNVAFYEVQVREVVEEKPIPAPPTDVPEEEPTTEETLVVDGDWMPVSTKPASILITDLKPLKRYEVRVRAKGTKGFGGFSDVVIMIVT
jgi:hypothetical protein